MITCAWSTSSRPSASATRTGSNTSVPSAVASRVFRCAAGPGLPGGVRPPVRRRGGTGLGLDLDGLAVSGDPELELHDLGLAAGSARPSPRGSRPGPSTRPAGRAGSSAPPRSGTGQRRSGGPDRCCPRCWSWVNSSTRRRHSRTSQDGLWKTTTEPSPVDGSWAFRPWLSRILTFRGFETGASAPSSTTGGRSVHYFLGIVVPRPWSIVIIFASCCSAFSVRANVVSAIIGLKRWREIALG